MITLTLSAGQIFYFGGCTGVMISGIILLLVDVLIRSVRRYVTGRPSGAHGLGVHRDGYADRYAPMINAAGYRRDHIPRRLTYS